VERVKEIIFNFQVIKTKRRVCSEPIKWETKDINKGMGEEDKIEEEKIRLCRW
jgi:predicted NACHT family NTPase